MLYLLHANVFGNKEFTVVKIPSAESVRHNLQQLKKMLLTFRNYMLPKFLQIQIPCPILYDLFCRQIYNQCFIQQFIVASPKIWMART